MNEEISIHDFVKGVVNLFKYLRTKWVKIIVVVFLGGGIGFTYAYIQKPKYTAVLTFALEDEKGGGAISGALGLASTLGFDMGGSAGGAFSGSNLIELMKSRRLVEQTLLSQVTSEGKEITLVELYLKFTGLRSKWEEDSNANSIFQFLPGKNRAGFSLQQDSLLGLVYADIVKNKLVVEQKDKKVSIISLSVTSDNELFSKYFAETLAKEVSVFYIDTKSKKARNNVIILQKQSDSIRTELNNAITGVAIANDNTYNLNPAFNVKRTPSSKRQIDIQANTAILTQLVTNLEMAKATLLKETPLIQVIDTPILPLSIIRKSKLVSAIQFAFVSGLLMVLFFSARLYFFDLQKVKESN